MKPTPEPKFPTVGNLPKPLIGAKVTHRNAPERIGVVLSVQDGVAAVEYTHADGLGRTFSTFGDYAVAELTTI